jgi:hypothetical protein
VVLIAALVALVTPAVALADGVTFGFIGGSIFAVQPASGGAIGTSATNAPTLGPARLTYVSRFAGNSVPGGGVLPPQIPPTFGSVVYPNTFNFGGVTFTTGTASAVFVGGSSSSVTYDAGGSITVTSNGTLLPAGTIFSGSFTGPTTLASTGAPASPICTTCSFWYSLTGPVSGAIDPGLMALLGLSGPSAGNGLFFSFVVGFVGPDDTIGKVEGGNISVIVPEPGTLALFGTGLIGVAGFIRRRFKA